jgi:diaminohydroxyphosphoribosylaminopyrimidine deaminase/5-amino-6-(5-phosphoribosylamino)uracil reductase
MDTERVITDKAWSRIIAARGNRTLDIAEPWRSLFAPLVRQDGDRPWVIGQLGQSLDGRIATPTGHSHYINGKPAIIHLHRLRALVDAVVVGIGTVLADDPQLTVRHVTGSNPARVVIDTKGRLPTDAKLLHDDGCRRVIVTESDTELHAAPGAEILRIPRGPTGQLDPVAIIHGLHALGFQRILVEGGMTTVSAFLASRCLDRLHIAIAPIILGSGPVGMSLPAIERVDQCLRPATFVYRLGQDLLIDCDLANA